MKKISLEDLMAATGGSLDNIPPEPDEEDTQNQESFSPNNQTLEVLLEKKGRGGKTAVIICGFEGPENELKQLGKTLKAKCGVGGSVRNGEILIQGNVRDKVMNLLTQMGYKAKRVGG